MRFRVTQSLLLGFTAAICACAPAAGDDRAALATASAREFIGWYLSPLDSGGAGGSIEHAVRLRPAAFDSVLLAALRADLAASAASPGEIVGLDFDPVTASQDPCERYDPQPAQPNGDAMSVTLVESCAAAQGRPLPAALQLRQRGDRWLVTNVVYPDSSDLLGILRRLENDRRAAAPPPTA